MHMCVDCITRGGYYFFVVVIHFSVSAAPLYTYIRTLSPSDAYRARVHHQQFTLELICLLKFWGFLTLLIIQNVYIDIHVWNAASYPSFIINTYTRT